MTTQINQLTELTTTSDDDLILIREDSTGIDKKMKAQNIRAKATTKDDVGLGNVTNDAQFKLADAGTAATADVTTSATDTTAGRLLKVGDFGVGQSGDTPQVSDLNDIPATGFYRAENTTQNTASNIHGAIIHLQRSDASSVFSRAQLQVSADRSFKYRVRMANAWEDWRELYHTGNIAYIRDGDNNPVEPQFPEGAVIERGSNANGEFVRFADGTQITYSVHDFDYRNSSTLSIDWVAPADFVGSTSAVFPESHAATDRVDVPRGSIAGIEWRRIQTSTGNAYYRAVDGTTPFSETSVLKNVLVTVFGRWF